MLPVKFAAFSGLNVKSKDDAVFGDTVSCLVIRAQAYCCDCHLAAASQAQQVSDVDGNSAIHAGNSSATYSLLALQMLATRWSMFSNKQPLC